eukprot:TRINITY_DN22243_c0_g1_i5.p1 TRINITY_DN22243_c0_g1~~TRINITY_DN22243_c0_g1_i5.p1  ORF type:complete len:590 (+),score=51.81 TRINITY_DN22243_c0_g1_i5:685-2454(+)
MKNSADPAEAQRVHVLPFGKPGSLSYRILFSDASQSLLSPLHDIPLCSPFGGFSCVCTTPAGSWLRHTLADEPFDPICVEAAVPLDRCETPLSRLSQEWDGRSTGQKPEISPKGSSISIVPEDEEMPSPNETIREKSMDTGMDVSENAFPGFRPRRKSREFALPPLTPPSGGSSCPPVSITRRATVVTRSRSFSCGDATSSRSSGEISPLVQSPGMNAMSPKASLDRLFPQPSHFSDNSQWNLGFLTQTTVRLWEEPEPLEATAEKSPAGNPRGGTPSDGHSLEKSPVGTPQGGTSSPRRPLDIKAQRWGNPCPPLNVVDIGEVVRTPGEVYEVKPLACLTPEDAEEGEWTVVVIACADPLAALLEDGLDVEAHLPGRLKEVQQWAEKRHRGTSGSPGPLQLDCQLSNATAIISRCHESWSIKYGKGQGRPAPHVLPSLAGGFLELTWAVYTRGMSSNAIPFCRPDSSISNKTPSSKDRPLTADHRHAKTQSLPRMDLPRGEASPPFPSPTTSRGGLAKLTRHLSNSLKPGWNARPQQQKFCGTISLKSPSDPSSEIARSPPPSIQSECLPRRASPFVSYTAEDLTKLM